MANPTDQKNTSSKPATASDAKPKTAARPPKAKAPAKSKAAANKANAPAGKAASAAKKSASAKTAAKAKKAKPASPAKAMPVTAPKDKPKKTKLVRDSFTMPDNEYAALGEVKKMCLKAGIEVKKSELLRVGVAHVRKMDLAVLKQALASLAPLKAGRPKGTAK